MNMGYPTKIQVIKRTNSEQWFINFPAAIAHAMEFDKGETVEWVIENKNKLILKRQQQKIVQVKKKLKEQL
jgi:antitoxin component of MazEF toxin-antitoxin module